MERQQNSKDTPGRLFVTGSGFYYYTGKLFDLVAVSVFWLLGSLLIVTIGTSFAALYATATGPIRKDTGTIKDRFWQVYRRDFKASLPLLVLSGGVLFVLLLNIGIVWKTMTGLVRLFLLLLYGLLFLLAIAVICYAFPALSRFSMPTGWIIKLSLYMTFRYLPCSIVLVAITAAGYFLVLIQPVLVILVPGCAAVMISWIVEPLLAKSEAKDA